MAMTGGVALYSEQDPNYDQLIEQYAVLVKRIGHHLKLPVCRWMILYSRA